MLEAEARRHEFEAGQAHAKMVGAFSGVVLLALFLVFVVLAGHYGW